MDLGLRTTEVPGLRLDDLHWREGLVCVRGKGRRVDALPLRKLPVAMRTVTLEEHFASPAFLEGPGKEIKDQANNPRHPQGLDATLNMIFITGDLSCDVSAYSSIECQNYSFFGP